MLHRIRVTEHAYRTFGTGGVHFLRGADLLAHLLDAPAEEGWLNGALRAMTDGSRMEWRMVALHPLDRYAIHTAHSGTDGP